MQKGLLKILISFAIIVFGIVGIGLNTRAYTEEQKQQAKAWLSAHGYSPDSSGAAAAYQDYLNGKFDEELGITRETSTQDTSEDDSDGADEKDEKKEKTTEAQSTSVSDIYNTMRNERMTEEDTSSVENEEVTTENIYQQDQSGISESIESEQNVTTEENAEDDAQNIDDMTLYDKPASNDNDELFVYIVLLVVAILIVGGIVILFKDKKNVEKTAEDQQDENL